MTRRRKSSKKRFLGIALVLAFLGFGVQWALKKHDPLMDEEAQHLVLEARKIADLALPIEPVRSGDWLESHAESGQTFRQYLAADPVRLTETRGVLYVQPIGEFDEQQKKIVELSAEFLGIYFACPVTSLAPLTTDEAIPTKARRVHSSLGIRQINSAFILDEVLQPNLPDDAAALIAFTTADLYPQDDWNFVFGQASLRHRVGVWSLFRNGDPETEFEKCLLRTLKTASHETGHMFSMQHCIKFSCNMCGSNNLEEADRQPLQLCPECIAKVWYATDCEQLKRFQELAAFCERNRLSRAATYFADASRRLSGD